MSASQCFPGPFCQEASITVEKLRSGDLPSNVAVCNGLVLELYAFITSENLSTAAFVKMLQNINESFNGVARPSALMNKVNRVLDQKKKLAHRKKVKGVKTINELLRLTFHAPASKPAVNDHCSETTESSVLNIARISPTPESHSPQKDSVPNDNEYNNINIPTIARMSPTPESHSPQKDSVPNDNEYNIPTIARMSPTPESHSQQKKNVPNHKNECKRMVEKMSQTEDLPDSELNEKPGKLFNLMNYKYNVLTKQNNLLTRKLQAKRILLRKVDRSLGHYSVRNVNKRDDTAKKNLQQLRETQKRNTQLENKNCANRQQIESYKKSKKELQDRIVILEKENNEIREKMNNSEVQVQTEKAKKLAAQKGNSYLKGEITELRENILLLKSLNSDKNHDECNSNLVKLKLSAEEKEENIKYLQQELEEANEKLYTQSTHVITKNSDGSFSDILRLCVIELAGLEVAVEKISPVIRAVSKHIFSKELSKSDLPSASTVQSIVDEGHFITKTFIAQKIESSENWGLARDGTSRRRQKILDTSVTLDTGDVMSLGFTRVVNETAETIQSVTERHLTELGNVSEKKVEDFVTDSLNKLSFTMSDRAANEKKADKLLDDWKEEMLINVAEPIPVHHLHCMAHVLLGFHNNLTPELKQLEAELLETSGPVGRDTLPAFKTWSKRETFVERTARTTSGIFGPAGEHLGVRDKWEAYCSANGIKSRIGNYRDNRFNAIFQTSAEVFLHRKDFLIVLETVKKPNLKLQAVKSDLGATEVCALLQCLGLFYIKLTGPYWNLITNGKVPYFELHKYVQEIQSFLEECERSPEILLQSDRHWTELDPLEIGITHQNKELTECLFTLHEDTRDLLFASIPIVAKALLKTINKQLVDFLPGGKHSESLSNTEQERMRFAPLTNLSCEHHFGDLDSSQRRRPNASYHHHSTIQLLKRNRSHLMEWMHQLDANGRSNLMLKARKGGRSLRQKHRSAEKDVLKTINDNMTADNEIPKKRKNGSKVPPKDKKHKVSETQMEVINGEQAKSIKNFTVGECVAVAYQDNWYPGYVEKLIDDSTAVVKFMTHCRKRGYFQWPQREDKQIVHIQFVIENNLVPDCVNSGRQWFVEKYSHLDYLYSIFCIDFFA